MPKLWEIERKFLVRLTGPYPVVRHLYVIQRYLWVGKYLEWRVRRTHYAIPEAATRCFMSIKIGSGIKRLELETRIPAILYTALAVFTERRVDKARSISPAGWELDRFNFDLEGLSLLEIEMSHPSAPLPALPSGVRFIRDVTNDPAFSNKALASLSPIEAEAFVQRAYA